VIVLVSAAVVGAASVGVAVGSTTTPAAQDIHVVFVSGDVKFIDFDDDGMGFGDRLSAVGPLLDETQSKRVGTAYLDCSIVSPVLEGGNFDCTYVLKFRDGDITTHGIDPQGPSDVLFAVTGGDGAYRSAAGQARYIDTDVTDIIIDLD
jgi:hypothetical protein